MLFLLILLCNNIDLNCVIYINLVLIPESVVSTKSEDKDNYDESNKKECFGFNWVIPNNVSAQQRLENIKK